MEPVQEGPDSAPPQRSGSAKRQRGCIVPIRMLETEKLLAQAKAAAAGLTLGSYGRTVMLGDAGPRARHAPTINAELLAHALAQLRKAGSNLNQVAHVLNAGQAAGSRETTEAVAGVNLAVRQILDLLGRVEPS